MTNRVTSVPDPVFAEGFHSNVDRLIRFRGRTYIDGWAFHESAEMRQVGYTSGSSSLMPLTAFGLPSADVAAHFGEKARSCRFSFEIEEPAFSDPEACRLLFSFEGGRRIELADLAWPTVMSGPIHTLLHSFTEMLRDGGARRVLELGANTRSGESKGSLLPSGCELVGLDIVEGPGVDIVADAHELSRHFEPESFDACYSISTFEHLAMPWKVALELNAVLKDGGLVFVGTHQSWPVHDAPCDYFRFSTYAWPSLFNRATGFEIVETAMGLPGSLLAHTLTRDTVGLEGEPCFLGSGAIVRKIGPSSVRWEVDLSEITRSRYPR